MPAQQDNYSDEDVRRRSISSHSVKFRDDESVHDLDFYDDDDLFDNLMSWIPDEERGSQVLGILLISETLLLLVALLSHHSRSPYFGCCNLFVVGTCLFFLLTLVPYLYDWVFTGVGNNPQWHRGNIFIPFAMFALSFCFWITGTVSMLGTALGVDIFEWVNLTDLNAVEHLSWVVCTVTVFPCAILLFMIDYTHRNNLGFEFYYIDERPGALVDVEDKPTPNKGFFEFSFWKWLTLVCQIDTTKKARDNIEKWIATTAILQGPFYVFIGVAFSQISQSSILPMTILAFGFLALTYNWQYLLGAISKRGGKVTREWNRVYLWFPTKIAILLLMIYFVTMSNMFFKGISVGKQLNVWEAIPELNAREKFYLWFNVLNLFCVFLLCYLLAFVHLKAWVTARNKGKGRRDPINVRAEKSVFGVAIDVEEEKEIGSDGEEFFNVEQPGSIEPGIPPKKLKEKKPVKPKQVKEEPNKEPKSILVKGKKGKKSHGNSQMETEEEMKDSILNIHSRVNLIEIDDDDDDDDDDDVNVQTVFVKNVNEENVGGEAIKEEPEQEEEEDSFSDDDDDELYIRN